MASLTGGQGAPISADLVSSVARQVEEHNPGVIEHMSAFYAQHPALVKTLGAAAVAVAMRDGPEAGLALIDAILSRGDLADYHLAHSARADLCRRLGRSADARASYQRALALARQEPEQRFLRGRLVELGEKK